MVAVTPDKLSVSWLKTLPTDVVLVTPDRLTVLDDDGVIELTDVVKLTPVSAANCDVTAVIVPVEVVLLTPLSPIVSVGLTEPTDVVLDTADSWSTNPAVGEFTEVVELTPESATLWPL